MSQRTRRPYLEAGQRPEVIYAYAAAGEMALHVDVGVGVDVDVDMDVPFELVGEVAGARAVAEARHVEGGAASARHGGAVFSRTRVQKGALDETGGGGEREGRRW